MAGSISVGGKVIATHTGPKGAGTVDLDVNKLKLIPGSAPSSPVQGDMYLDSSDNNLKMYNGSFWKVVVYNNTDGLNVDGVIETDGLNVDGVIEADGLNVSGTIIRTGAISGRKIPMTDSGIYIACSDVPNDNVFHTVFSLRDINASLSGTEYSFTETEVGGIISIYGEFNNAALHALVAFSGKHFYNFTHLSILSSYAYNSSIQINGRDIQIRQAGYGTNPPSLRIFTYPAR